MSRARLTATGVVSLGPKRRVDSFNRLAITDSLFGLGILSGLAGVVGVFDDLGDGVVLLVTGLVSISIGTAGRRTYEQRHRPTPARVVSGLAATWVVLVVVGTGVYLASSATDSAGTALFESASGFSTTALTVLDPTQLSVGVQLFRGSTQWLGAMIGLMAAVVSLPGVLRGSVHVPVGQGRRLDRLAPDPATGRRRVTGIYVGLTIVCGLAYAGTGMGTKDSFVHALTTVSTGGFTNQTDSFASYGSGPQIVATVFMTLAGISYFVFWWVLRGQTRRFIRSTEMWLYFAMIATATVAILIAVDGIALRHALFQAASAASTTGFASADWTAFPSSALAVLLIATATGAMGASAGGGLGIARAGALVAYVKGGLRRQLDSHIVTVIKREGRAVDDEELARLTGYQIAHVGLCAVGAFLLATTGVDIVSSLWTSISALSTAGPSPITGPNGDATNLPTAARFLLIPGMLAGRLTILPLLAAVVGLLQVKDHSIKRVKRLLRSRR